MVYCSLNKLCISHTPDGVVELNISPSVDGHLNYGNLLEGDVLTLYAAIFAVKPGT